MLKINSSKKARARKQAGFVVTVELLLITTILGLGLITGFTKVRDQVLAELSDSGAAVGAINQSYQVAGTEWSNAGQANIALVSGFAYQDDSDPANVNFVVGGDNTYIQYLSDPTPSTVAAGLSEDTKGNATIGNGNNQ